ncbi:MAG: DUF5691 domain-containing protein [Propionibacteriaceae bacterium]|nr:DUF5691 domain-containing protein [Propionibacteriaceae bacterium]
MTTLDPLVPVAVVGTARRALDPGDLPAGAGGPDLAGLAPARALLAIAARAAVIDRIALPVGEPGDDPGPEPETRAAPASPFYVGTLNQALGGERWRAVAESLRHLAATDQRVPVGALHRLLQAAEDRRELRADLAAVLGARGRWLMERNPRWQFPEWLRPDIGDERAWRNGTPAERLAWLHSVRAADPERARELLMAAGLAGDPPTRAAQLEVLRDGITAADEPLLETALDDRAREVRALARDLLALLPESQFVARMRERVRTRVEIAHGRWSVDLTGLDSAAARDGLTVSASERPPGAAAVRALTGGVPLDSWHTDLGTAPADLLHVRDGRLELGPVPGLRDAAIRERDAGLARTILTDPRWEVDPLLVAVLDPIDADDVLALRARRLEPYRVVPELRIHGFGRETAEALLEWLADNRSHGKRTAVLATLGDWGPLDQSWDLALELRRIATALLAVDRAHALDAAMTINLRRSLRAEAEPPFTLPPPTDEESR